MAYYDDSDYYYDRFWQDREYEHRSELMALVSLLDTDKSETVADIGGGYGRLSKWLGARYSKVFLVEPSQKMRAMAKNHLKKSKNVIIRNGSAQDTNLPAKSVDAIVMVRVMHHLPTPAAAIAEMHRILKPGGILILEFANSIHFLARLRSWLTGRLILPQVIERRSPKNIAAGTIPFVNHHPSSVQKLLTRHGFEIVQVLSVSNWRSGLAKKFIPLPILLGLESIFQKFFSGLYFGPSILVSARKLDKKRTL